MKKITVLVLSFLLVGAIALYANGKAETTENDGWQAERTISLIVPWGAGGATDQTARVLASEMETLLGGKIAVVNQPGASGATGQRSGYDAPHDGYTWVANADSTTATYQVMGLVDNFSHRDWKSYFAIKSPCIIAVNADSEIKDWKSLINAFKTREVAVASAGIGAGGHIAAEVFTQKLGLNYKHVPYKGGNPAVVSTVSGETEVVMQLSMEMADMLRAGKLRAIAVLDNEDIEIKGMDPIPAVTKFESSMPPVAFHFGLYVPADLPSDIIEAVDNAFVKAAASEEIKKLAETKSAVAVSYYGNESDKVLDNAASMFGWLLYDSEVAKISPDKFNIPKPQL